MSALESEKISPEDLQNKFNELQANLDSAASSAMDTLRSPDGARRRALQLTGSQHLPYDLAARERPR